MRLYVEIPALTELVSFLKSNQQSHIDTLTSTVKLLTKRLQDSSIKLNDQIQKEK